MLRTTETTRRAKAVPVEGARAAPAGTPLKANADADAERRAAKIGLVEGLGDAAHAEAVRHPAIARLGADLDQAPDGHVGAAHHVIRGEAVGDVAVVVRLGVADRADAAAEEVGDGRGD